MRCDSGKGTPRRKVKKVHKSAGTDDKKLQGALKKLNVQPIQAIEEVNMFKTDGNVIHFSAPKGKMTPLQEVRYAVLTCIQFTLQFPPTPSPFMAMVRTRNSPSSFLAFLTSLAPIR